MAQTITVLQKTRGETLAPAEGFLDASGGALEWGGVGGLWSDGLSRSQFGCGERAARPGVEGKERRVAWGGGDRLRGALDTKQGLRFLQDTV